MSRWNDDVEDDWYGGDEDRRMFKYPDSNSALRAATATNPCNHPYPNCGEPNKLTPVDVALGYQCDECADRAEHGWDY